MIILFGPAGSGKTTQGRLLADKYGWKWLSVGQVLRDTGKFGDILKTGELVENNEVVRLMNHEIDKADADGMNVILDGYPRDVEQAKWMEENNFFKKIELALILDVPKEELWRRIEERGRADDTKEAIERRFEIFEQNIYSIIPFLENGGVKVLKVDGVGSFEEVTERLMEALKKNIDGLVVQDEDMTQAGEQSYGE